MSTTRTLLTTILIVAALSSALHAQDATYIDPRLATVRKVFIDDSDDLNTARPVIGCFVEHLARNTPLTIVTTKADADAVLKFAGGPPLDTRAFAYAPADVDGWKLWTGVFAMNPKYRGPDASCQIADKLAADLLAAMRKAKAGH